jgi:hypothetical protein
MKELYAYVEQKNAWGKLFGSESLSLGRTEDRQRIADALDSDLSPENLTCDGELSRSQVQAKYTRLSRAARQLQDLDPAVKFYEFG